MRRLAAGEPVAKIPRTSIAETKNWAASKDGLDQPGSPV